MLLELDGEMAQRLLASDRQRLARALEVIDGTGKSLLYWQKQPEHALIDPATAVKLVIELDRAELYRRCDARFDDMMNNGAREEVEKIMALQLSPTLPSMRALGVRPLSALIAGNMSEQDAIEQAKTETRQYAKRQSTWIQAQYDYVEMH